MVIGVDFDNTLICYDQVFHRIAVEEGLIPHDFPAQKRAVRDAIRTLAAGEAGWQRLQGMAYGPRIREASQAPGAIEFLRHCGKEGIPVFIISHKSEFATSDPTMTPLRAAARTWLTSQGFFYGTGLTLESLRFGSTRQEKVGHIRDLACTHFIDDLEETFREPEFPLTTRGFLYQPGNGVIPANLPDIEVVSSWDHLKERLFGV